jgi:cytochrome c-type biogenesis protein CcmF
MPSITGTTIFLLTSRLPTTRRKEKIPPRLQPQELSVGDTVFYSKGFAVLEDLESHKNIPGAGMGPDDSASVATVKVLAKTGSVYTIKPILITKGGAAFNQPDTVTAESLIVQLQKVSGNAELGIKENEALLEYITLKRTNSHSSTCCGWAPLLWWLALL